MVVFTILITSSEFFELRPKLKESTSAESGHLLCCLYQTSCHSQVGNIIVAIGYKLVTFDFGHVDTTGQDGLASRGYLPSSEWR